MTGGRAGGPRLYLGLVGLGLMLLLPLWAPNRFWVNLGSQALIFAIFAMSLDLQLGYAGMPSFGHAAPFAAGAYTAALFATRFEPGLLPMLGAAILAGAAIACLMGLLTVRSTGVYFLMLTLALSQILWSVISNNQLKDQLGGDIGLVGVPRAHFWPFSGFDLILPINFYLVVLGACILTYLLLLGLVRAPFGRTLVAIRENEARVRALGCPTHRYRLAAATVSGALAGLAGALSSQFNLSATPSMAFWTVSGLVMIAVIVGGAGTLLGPAFGAILVAMVQTGLGILPIRELSLHWQLLLGLGFVLAVLLMPAGLAGGPRRPVPTWLRPLLPGP